MKMSPEKPDFQALFESCPGLYLVLLPDSPVFTIVAASNAYLQATMSDRENIIGKGIFEAFPDNPQDPHATGVRNLRTSLERVVLAKTFDAMALQKYDIARPAFQGGGFEERYWSPANSPVLNGHGEISYIIHRVEDVTELMRLKQKGLGEDKNRAELNREMARKEIDLFHRAKDLEDAHASGQLARIILEEMYQFVGLLDAEGRFLEINKPALDGSGLPKSEVLGAYLWEVSPWKVSEDNPKKVHNAFLRATKGEFVREELELLAGAGGTQIITIDFSLIPIRDESGKIAYYLGEGRNITEKKMAEAEIERKNAQLNELNEKLKQLDQLKTQFFANVSHELRTPLTLILGPAEKLRDNPNISSQQKQELEIIIRNGRLLLKHVNDLLDVSRLEAGKIMPSYVKFNLGVLIKSIAANFDGLARDKKIVFGLDLGQPLMLEADPNMVQRVLLNLVGNAFKFTPQGGRIRIEAHKKHEEIVISVQDTGPGIPLKLREEIFERFKQGEDPMTKRFGGTGLGLAIAKEFVELHQGAIAVEDSAAGGAKFIVRMPLKAPPNVVIDQDEMIVATSHVAQSLAELKEIPRPPKAVSQGDGTKGLVLIVEDNADLSRFLTDILSVEFQVETAFDGQEGLQKAVVLTPDLILSDIMMPKMSGDRMVAEIRRRPQLDSVPIVLLTAKADEQLRIQLLKGGAQDYVLKPFFSEEVLARVHNLVAVKRSREHLQRELQSTERDLQVLTGEILRSRHQLMVKSEELQRLNGILQDSIHGRDEFLAIASHELNTPISALKMQLQMVNRKINVQGGQMPSPDALKKSFDMTLRQVDIFVNLINNLLDASRIRLGRMVLNPSVFNLTAFVKEFVESFAATFSAAGSPIQLEMDNNDIMVEWDRMRVQEILVNLLSNAVKYAPGSPVKLCVRPMPENKAMISVEDQGPGIDGELQEAIFDRFQKRASTENPNGMGLGLFIVKHLVTAHQGMVRLESKKGQGAKFIVEIPRTLDSRAVKAHE